MISYLQEIAKSQNVSYEPDADVLREDEVYCAEEAGAGFSHSSDKCLIDLGNNSGENRNHGFPPSGPSGGGGGGFGAFSAPPPLPSVPPSAPYPSMSMNTKPIGFNIDSGANRSASVPTGPHPPSYDTVMSPNESKDQPDSKPKPLPRANANPSSNLNDSFPELPSVPIGNLPDIPNDEPKDSKDESIDFDDLTKRFEDLKKRK